MHKSDALAAMGPSTLLFPAWIKAALVANDRLELYLTVLQAAAAHAEHPESVPLDLRRETAAAGADGRWLSDLPAACSQVDGAFLVPGLRGSRSGSPTTWVGCTAMQLDETGRTLQIGEATLREGDLLTLDGNDGAVYAGAVHTAIEPLRDLQARLRHLRAARDAPPVATKKEAKTEVEP